MGKKIVIVGGVAGGATAATRLRRLDEDSHIVILERGEHKSFANCGLPYYIGGTISKREKLLVQTVQGMSQRYKLDIRTKSEAVNINAKENYVEVQNLVSGEHYTERYDYLILSPGASPVIPKIEGLSSARGVFTLRSIPDAETILTYIEEKKPQRAVVLGGGFIGLEMAENLTDRGLKVSIVEATNQVQPSIDYEMARLLHYHLQEKGVDLFLQDKVVKLENGTVILESGRELPADLVLIAIGVRPENDLALKAGLETGEKGAIRVNEYLQTSVENIYAIGDVIEVKNYLNGVLTHIPLAWPANRQGRIVADNIYGYRKAYWGTLGTSVVKVFDLTAASTGLNEKTLIKLGIPYRVVHIHPNSHAGYYPGASPLALKLIFNEEGKIFGAQAVGREGVDKRIDVLATAIKGNLNVYDLQELELAYAPPYSSAKDPVNLLGYAAANVLDGLVKTVQYNEIDELVAAGALLIDVREPQEVKFGKIPGSINIPLAQLRDRLEELPKNEPIYITCQVGLRGYIAARILVQKGYEAINLDGGYLTYTGKFPAKSKEGKRGQTKIDDTGKIVTEVG